MSDRDLRRLHAIMRAAYFESTTEAQRRELVRQLARSVGGKA